MAITTGHLTPSQKTTLKIIYAFLSFIAVVLIALAYSRNSHNSNIDRGAFDRTTEGAGPVKNP